MRSDAPRPLLFIQLSSIPRAPSAEPRGVQGSADPGLGEQRLQRGVYLQRWCRAKLQPPAGLGNSSISLQPLLAGGPEGLQHPRGDGGLGESTAGLPRQTLPLCTINSPPVSARSPSLHWHPSSCRHNTSADTPTPQGTLSLITPNPLPAPDPKGNREVFL